MGGLTCRSPAFPEMSCLPLMHLRKVKKRCRSEPLRRQLQGLIEKADKSAEEVRHRRDAIPEAQKALKTKLLVFQEDSLPLARERLVVLKRRQAEEQSRVEAEMQEGKDPKAAS